LFLFDDVSISLDLSQKRHIEKYLRDIFGKILSGTVLRFLR
jgi:hypothetical protein